MQKLADGHDTDVGSSLPWLWSRCVAAAHAGAALDCGAAGWPAGELAPGSGGAGDDLLHPVAAPMSRTNTQADASPSRLVMCAREDGTSSPGTGHMIVPCLGPRPLVRASRPSTLAGPVIRRLDSQGGNAESWDFPNSLGTMPLWPLSETVRSSA
jgi:hypothetical protein